MWIDQEDEERLTALRRLGKGASILSVYLPIPPGATRQAFAAALLNLLRDGREHEADDTDAYDSEAARVLAYIRDEYVSSGRTLAVFSSEPRKLFVPLRFQVAIPGSARLGSSAYLAPINAAIDDNPRVVIAVVDEREARIFTASLDRIESERRVKDDVPGRQRQGGWTASRYELDRAHHVGEHLRLVADKLQVAYTNDPFKRLVIGAAPETLFGLTEQLSAELQSLVAGSFASQMFSTEHELVDAGLEVAATAERAEELALVEKILDSAGATVGWEPTLRALGEGRVHELAISRALIGQPETDEALRRARDTGAIVEYVRGEADDKLGAGEGIAALLRY